jgi:hypothetical protein
MPATTTRTERLTPAELALVLLAGVGHPNEEFRRSLLRRLDEAVDAMEPCYPAPTRSRRELRTFFHKQDRRRKGGVRLNPIMREVAVRLTLLAFTAPENDRQCRLLVGESSSATDHGFLVDPNLDVIDLRRSALTRHRLKRRQVDCLFYADTFRRRLNEIRRGEAPVKAVCRVTDRIVLELTGPMPWSLAPRGNLPLFRSPYPGWSHERDGSCLRLWPDSPEGLIRLTAGMAAGHTLCFQGPYPGRSGAVLVRLREFEGEAIEFPVKVTPSNNEAWLSRIPGPPMTLTDDDRLALARWAHPLANWITPGLTERLF